MTAAAIMGSFSEFRMVKTRSVCVLSIEIPVEQADAALSALGGVPQPGKERPVAVALLDPTIAHSGPLAVGAELSCSSAPSDTTPPEPQAPPQASGAGRAASSQDKMVVRAALLCTDERFQRWMWERTEKSDPPEFWQSGSVFWQQHTADALRRHCGVSSRRDLAIDTDARRRFEQLEDEFMVATGRRPWRRPDERRAG